MNSHDSAVLHAIFNPNEPLCDSSQNQQTQGLNEGTSLPNSFGDERTKREQEAIHQGEFFQFCFWNIPGLAHDESTKSTVHDYWKRCDEIHEICFYFLI